MIKKLLIIIVIFLTQNYQAFAEEKGCGAVYSSLVFEEKTGNILYENMSEKISYPASLVKVMTLYLVFEALEKNKLQINQILTVSEHGEEIAAVNKINTLKLKQGDKITVMEAIKAVIVKSFNEAAVTLAEAVSEDEWTFTRKMNQKAEELGMINSSFRNASGLHEEGQYTSSRDLARLVGSIKRDFPQYYHLFATKNFKYRGTEYETHNYVLSNYKGAEGLKTGFTKAAGFNLISVAKRNNERVISVLLGCESNQKRDYFTEELLDEAFNDLSKNQENKINIKLSKKFDYFFQSDNEYMPVNSRYETNQEIGE